MKVIVKSVAPTGFFRAGRHWPAGGTTVDPEAFDARDWARIASEPNLKITPAAPEAAPQPARDSLVMDAIRSLAPEAFGQDGKPNVGPVNDAMPKGQTRVTAAERDAALEALVAGGFEIPKPAA